MSRNFIFGGNMGYRIDLNVDAVQNAVAQLLGLSEQLTHSGHGNQFGALQGFSTVSGLDGVGRTHSACVVGVCAGGESGVGGVAANSG